jgi:hypothetical protein
MLTAAYAQESNYHEYIQRLLDSNIKTWLQEPVVIESIKTQNTKHANLQQDQILSLDKQWKIQRTRKKKPLINAVLANPLSTFLKEIKEKNGDLFSEIFVMDNKGLNVGQSNITSDYWQGDEAKWQQTYLMGPEGLVIGDRDFDDSSSKFLIQISVSVTDPDSQEVIGAATIGVSLAKLLRASTVASTSP